MKFAAKWYTPPLKKSSHFLGALQEIFGGLGGEATYENLRFLRYIFRKSLIKNEDLIYFCKLGFFFYFGQYLNKKLVKQSTNRVQKMVRDDFKQDVCSISSCQIFRNSSKSAFEQVFGITKAHIFTFQIIKKLSLTRIKN